MDVIFMRKRLKNIKCFTKILSIKYFTFPYLNFTIWTKNILQLTRFYNKTKMIKRVNIFLKIFYFETNEVLKANIHFSPSNPWHSTKPWYAYLQ